jgi:hypothetical protein
MVAKKGLKRTDAPLILKLGRGAVFCWFWANSIWDISRDKWGGGGGFDFFDLEVSLQMPHYVVCLQKNFILHVLNQLYINSYCISLVRFDPPSFAHKNSAVV